MAYRPTGVPSSVRSCRRFLDQPGPTIIVTSHYYWTSSRIIGLPIGVKQNARAAAGAKLLGQVSMATQVRAGVE